MLQREKLEQVLEKCIQIKVVKNIISHIKGEALNAKYDGYTACPFITKIKYNGEFDWEGSN